MDLWRGGDGGGGKNPILNVCGVKAECSDIYSSRFPSFQFRHIQKALSGHNQYHTLTCHTHAHIYTLTHPSTHVHTHTLTHAHTHIPNAPSNVSDAQTFLPAP